MKRRLTLGMGHSPYILVMLAALLTFVLACGPGEEPTAVPTAIPTATAIPAATSTPTPVPGPVATPTPTVAAIPSPSPTAKKGGVLVIGAIQELPHYDFQNISNLVNSYYQSPIYNGVFYNPEGRVLVCDICVNEEFQLENAGKTLVFNIKPGIKFHNGQEMTAADVKYSLEKMIGAIDGVASVRCGVFKEYLDNIQVASPYQLRLNLLRPSAFVTMVLAMPPCVIHPAGTTRDQLQKEPLGTGPFRVKERVIGSHLTLERNPNYFKPGLPYLDNLTIRKLADDASYVIAFLAGRLDISVTPDVAYLPQVQKLVDQGSAAGVKVAQIRLNGLGMLMTRPPFDNLKMRKAVNLAFDRPAWGKAIFDNDYVVKLWYPTPSPFARPEKEILDVVPGWGTGAKKQQERDEARKLLSDAGYPTGIDNVDFIVASGAVLGAELAAAMLAEVGIRTKLRVMATADRDRLQQEGNWTIGEQVGTQLTGDPDELIGAYYITGGSRNTVGYSNKEFDQAYVQMSSELDPVKRAQLVRQLEDIVVVRDVLYAPYVTTYLKYFWYTYVKGYGSMGISASVYNTGAQRKEAVWLDGK